MAKKLYERWILHVRREKGKDATFEKLARDYKLIYADASKLKPNEQAPEPTKEIYEPVLLTEKEAEALNELSGQNGIGYFLPEEIKGEDGETSEDYNEEGYDKAGFNRAGKYNAQFDQTP